MALPLCRPMNKTAIGATIRQFVAEHANPLEESMINILQISDLHFLPQGQLAFGNIDSFWHLRNFSSFLPNLKANIDAIVFTGDIFQDGADESSCDYIKAVFKGYETFFLPGNHDKHALIGLLNGQDCSFDRFVRDWSECRIIGIDSSSGHHYGLLSNEKLDWLAEQIRVEKPILLFMHHPPVKAFSAFMDQHLDGMRGLQTVLAKKTSNIRICCGHLHRALYADYAGCSLFCCPSLSFEVELDYGPDGGNHYIAGCAMAALHTIDKTGRIVTQIVQIPGSYSYARYSFI